MLWLEMSRDENHGGGNWSFQKCLWSPTKKTNGTKWAFWETVRKVKEGDIVIHLRGKVKPTFVGYSIAATDGYETGARPPEPGEWGYADYYYRVDLKQFTPFPSSIDLRTVFAKSDLDLRNYFMKNKEIPINQRERLFYVIQAGRLQCLNGAYLSEVSKELLEILLLDKADTYSIRVRPLSIVREIDTSEALRQLSSRVGQREFSDNVRKNYENCCCFPQCNVTERSFLVGAHIARWADNLDLRGDLANGLCFCLMHDKAFEKGMFTLDLDFRVWSNDDKLNESEWGSENISPFIGMQIDIGEILPSRDAILEHWERVSLYPVSERATE